MKAGGTNINAHIEEEVTTLASCWRLTRSDNKQFYFTSHDQDLRIDLDGTGAQTYKASSSYNRSAVKNTEQLSVDNLDLTGVLDDEDIKENELRLGLFDFASIEIFMVDYTEPQPIPSTENIKIRKGRLGEVTITPNGFFQSELRGLIQAYQQRIGELYSPECRADLGDSRCKIPIQPPLVERNTPYVLDDFVRVTNDLSLCVLIVPADNQTTNDRSPLLVSSTLGSQAQVQENTVIVGTGAIEFSPSGSVDPSNSFVSFPDNANYSIAGNQFTIEGHVRFKTIGVGIQTLVSQWATSGDQRAWVLDATSTLIRFVFTTDGMVGTTVTVASNAVVLNADTDYHIAVTRDGSDDIRIFLDGVQVNTTANDNSIIHDSTGLFYLGKIRDAGGDDLPLDGFLDDVRFCIGKAIYTTGFTPPTEPVTNVDNVIAEDLDDRIYTVTMAGTTAPVQPVYDTVVPNTTTDGSVEFTAEESWSRAIQVIAVDVSKPRKIFTVTELTPNTGGPRGGFPDDWMNGGATTWESGDNAGRSMEIRDFIADDGITIEQEIELFLDMPFDIQVGDKARVYPGCDKSLIASCKDKFDNVINFRGEPFIPGNDVLFKIPDAKA